MNIKKTIGAFGLAAAIALTPQAGAFAAESGSSTSAGAIVSYGPNTLVKSDGSFWTWGLTRQQSVPTQIPELKGAKTVPGDDRMVVLEDGSVRRLQPDNLMTSLKVEKVEGITNPAAFSYTAEELALDTSGKVYKAARENGTLDATRFTLLSGIGEVKDIDGYSKYWQQGANPVYLFLKSDGTVWSSTDSLAAFRQVPGLTGVKDISGDIALKNDGTVWELVQSSNKASQPLTAKQIRELSGIQSIKFEGSTYLAVDSQSRLWFWGNTLTGYSDSAVTHTQERPILLTGVKNVKEAFVAEKTLFALTSSGQLYSTSLFREKLPANAPFSLLDSNIKTVKSGPRHLIMQKNDGSLWGWGVNKDGSLGNGEYEFMEKTPVPMQKPISVSLNGENIAMNTGVVTKDGQNFVPLRSVFEKLGAKITYEETSANKMISITRGAAEGKPAINIGVSAKTGATTVNGEAVKLPNNPFNLNGTMYLPLRFISEKLGAQVVWQPDTQTIEITMK